MSGAAVVVRQNRYIKAFAAAGAVDPARAAALEQLNLRDSWIFRRMVRAGVFIQASGDAFYLDEAGAAEFVEQRREKALQLLGLLLVAIVVFYLLAK